MNTKSKLRTLADHCYIGASNPAALIRSLSEAVSDLAPGEVADSIDLKVVLGQISFLLHESLGPRHETLTAFRNRLRKEGFELGELVVSQEVAEVLQPGQLQTIVARFHAGDWGSATSLADREANEIGLVLGNLQLRGQYELDADDGTKRRVWIITEADRSKTHLLFPDDRATV